MGLFSVVVGLMAFSATAAQAEPGAFWEVNGAPISSTLLPSIQARNDTPHTTFLTVVGATIVEILCGPIKLVNGKLHELGRLTGKLHYEECTTKLNGVTVNRCTPKSPGAPLGLIESNALKGLLKLHVLAGGATDDLLEVIPEMGAALFRLELGPLCALGNNFEIVGKLFLKDCQNELLINKVEHLFEEGPLTALLFGANPLTIDGSFWVFLTGAHEGMTYSGHPA